MRKRVGSALWGIAKAPWDRINWQRFLSPIDKEWTWQDSEPITAMRELLIRLSDIPRPENSHPPPYEEQAKSPGQLKALQVLAACKSAISMAEREMTLLVLELRSRGVSWTVIAMALECRPQSAHEKYKDLNWDHWERWLVFEVDAARRVALEITQSPDATDQEKEEAHDFLERSDFPEQVQTTKQLRRKHR